MLLSHKLDIVGNTAGHIISQASFADVAGNFCQPFGILPACSTAREPSKSSRRKQSLRMTDNEPGMLSSFTSFSNSSTLISCIADSPGLSWIQHRFLTDMQEVDRSRSVPRANFPVTRRVVLLDEGFRLVASSNGLTPAFKPKPCECICVTLKG